MGVGKLRSRAAAVAGGRARPADDPPPLVQAHAEKYEAIVAEFIGNDYLDRPMRERLDTGGEGAVLVITDPSDLGPHFRSESSPTEEVVAEVVTDAVLSTLATMPIDEADA